jgi:hypothetical protein
MSKSRKKLILTEAETFLVELEKIAAKGNETARSFINWWLTHKSWTEKQWIYIRHLVLANRRKPKKVKYQKFYLYAVSDGCAIKLGYSSNIKKRIAAMQTGHPIDLVLEWRYYTGRSKYGAAKAERMLHRHCSQHRLRGEWFSQDCLSLVKDWSM